MAEAVGKFDALLLAGLVLVGAEEGGDGGVADGADEVEALVGDGELLFLELGRGEVVGDGEEGLAFAQGGFDAVAHVLFKELAGGELGAPGEGLDLLGG